MPLKGNAFSPESYACRLLIFAILELPFFADFDQCTHSFCRSMVAELLKIIMYTPDEIWLRGRRCFSASLIRCSMTSLPSLLKSCKTPLVSRLKATVTSCFAGFGNNLIDAFGLNSVAATIFELRP